jgi:hypothetical protein
MNRAGHVLVDTNASTPQGFVWNVLGVAVVGILGFRLQPHKGLSGIGLLDNGEFYKAGFNPTRVCLECGP